MKLALVFLLFLSACTSGFDIDSHIEEKYPDCSDPVYCGDLAKVDCNSAGDGPLYYLNKNTGQEISVCGGACLRPISDEQKNACATLCPPKKWYCN